MTTRWTLILLLPLLLGFSAADTVKYMAEYNSSEIEAKAVFKYIEEFVISKGFELQQRMEETLPKMLLISKLQSGAPFQGGITLKLTLDEDSNHINLRAYRYHGGCSNTESIEKIDELRGDFQSYMKSKYGVSVILKNMQGIQ